MLYAHSPDRWGSVILRPLIFMLWPRISLKSELTYSLPNISGKKTSLRASSIGPIRDMTPRTVIYRYYHYNWSIIPKTVYSDWGYCLAILARV